MANELKNQRINEKFCLSIKGGKGRQTDLRMEGIFCGSSVHALLVFELLVQVNIRTFIGTCPSPRREAINNALRLRVFGDCSCSFDGPCLGHVLE